MNDSDVDTREKVEHVLKVCERSPFCGFFAEYKCYRLSVRDAIREAARDCMGYPNMMRLVSLVSPEELQLACDAWDEFYTRFPEVKFIYQSERRANEAFVVILIREM